MYKIAHDDVDWLGNLLLAHDLMNTYFVFYIFLI